MPTSGGTTHCGSNRTGKAGSPQLGALVEQPQRQCMHHVLQRPGLQRQVEQQRRLFGACWDRMGRPSPSRAGRSHRRIHPTRRRESAVATRTSAVYRLGAQSVRRVLHHRRLVQRNAVQSWNMQGKGSATIDGEVYKFFAGQKQWNRWLALWHPLSAVLERPSEGAAVRSHDHHQALRRVDRRSA